MKGSTSYVYRIVATSRAGTCTSQDYTVMTGAVPSSVPKPTATIMNAAAHDKGFIVTSSGLREPARGSSTRTAPRLVGDRPVAHQPHRR